MRNTTLLAALLASMLLLTGCDFFRTIAGRPTSEDIEAKRELIAREKAAHKHRLDSLQAVLTADSLARADSVVSAAEVDSQPEPPKAQTSAEAVPEHKVMITAKTVTFETRQALKNRYYVIIGSFSNPANADNLASKARAAGYQTYRIDFMNGFASVGAGATNNLNEALAIHAKLLKEKFCPADAWILDNK